MNIHIFKKEFKNINNTSKEKGIFVQKIINDMNKAIDMRDSFSHDWYEGYSQETKNFTFGRIDNEIVEMKNNVNILTNVLNIYMNYLDNNDPFAPGFKKVKLK